MDVIGDLLHGARAQGGMFCQALSSPPWSIRFVVPAPMTLTTMVRGEAWMVPDVGEARLLRPGDVALTHGERPFVIADSPETVPLVFIYGETCMGEVNELGPGTYGSVDGDSLMVIGSYQVGGDRCRRLFGVLPKLLVVPGDDARLGPALELIRAEIAGSAPGRQVVVDRLLDVLLVVALRAWFAREEADTPRWYAALGDPQVGRALRLIHEMPAAAWTVVSLAEAVGMSRAAFARRFSALVGQPPLTYLTEWRMTLAADLLARPETTVAAAARHVGYADAFGFSAAFKRVRGVSPSVVRAGR